MAIFDKFKKKDKSKDYPTMDSGLDSPGLGPAGSLKKPSSDSGVPPLPTRGPEVTQTPALQNIEALQNRIDLLISKIDALKSSLDMLNQRISQLEQQHKQPQQSEADKRFDIYGRSQSGQTSQNPSSSADSGGSDYKTGSWQF